MAFYIRKPYVSVWARRRCAARDIARFAIKGRNVSPVVIDGRAIATTFWGKAWCANLERYSDFENRLPRGRSYVRNGSVVDLQIAPSAISARVRGSSLYRVQVNVAVLPEARWRAICGDCAGEIDSLVELLQGRLSTAVITRICQDKAGLFPSPSEITFTCSCPDWASMCKHVAAVLYGIGARLDDQPDLLFVLRNVDQQDLIAEGGQRLPESRGKPAAGKVLDAADLSELFGIEISQTTPFDSRTLAQDKPMVRRKFASAKRLVQSRKLRPQ